MLKWLTKSEDRQGQVKSFGTVAEGLQKAYKEKLWPIEKEHDFWSFYSPELADADFSSRPMVLLMGQYSTGKSTFIRHLLGRDYPGLRIGPEPTTDKFVAICHGDSDQVVPGNAVVVDKTMPFTQLSNMGNNFLSRFECSKCNSPVLEGITLIDSPGVLSGEKQRVSRGYDFEQVVKWFADRVDMILLLFDVSKLDISDEFRRTIMAIRGNDIKVNIILNKADCVNTQQLMRVYGALMWSLGKVIDTPEVSRVYIGSFWDQPLQNDEQRKLFEAEENELYTALAQLPRGAATRKVNDLIKRARLAKVHAFILKTLRKRMPSMFGKAAEQKKMLESLGQIFKEIATERNLPLGDFPDPSLMKQKLSTMDFSKFSKMDKKKIDILDQMLAQDIPELLRMMPDEAKMVEIAEIAQIGAAASPFAEMKIGGPSAGYQSESFSRPDPEEFRAEFEALGPNDSGKLSGQKARVKLVESKLPSNVLHKIWQLADIDKDGFLSLYEYALACQLIKIKLEGTELPPTLPPSMMPPTRESVGE